MVPVRERSARAVRHLDGRGSDTDPEPVVEDGHIEM
jgi:hypothetical protein